MKSRLNIVHRAFWVDLIESAWKRRSVVWLSGVRRAGKTLLVRSLPDAAYFDCELPGTRRLMEDPERFLKDNAGERRLAIDEIHLLDNPSQLLKIAADYHPDLRVVATGSSTLAASTRFKDTLTGRKEAVNLTPMISQDLSDFSRTRMQTRLYHGGLPSFFLSPDFPSRDFEEWLVDYWAKDIQQLFRLQNRHSFLKFSGLLFAQSGGVFEASRFAAPCGVSHVTIGNYLQILEETYVVQVVRPFSSRRSTEIVSAPKVYGFDTGFVCSYKGWSPLRPSDCGLLWEHFVLNEIQARLQTRGVSYWRDKRGHEVDFVLAPHGKTPIAIECKWSERDFDPSPLQAFRRQYPDGDNYVVCENTEVAHTVGKNGLEWRFVSLAALINALARPSKKCL